VFQNPVFLIRLYLQILLKTDFLGTVDRDEKDQKAADDKGQQPNANDYQLHDDVVVLK
jgi:hypothetical protein